MLAVRAKVIRRTKTTSCHCEGIGLGQPTVLALDEATSSVDRSTENTLMRDL